MADPVLHSPKNPHFFKPLPPDFQSHLEIPEKFFSVHIEGRNERSTVELRCNACEINWIVKMEGRRLTVGWKHFADAHGFRIRDIIIFRHEGDLVFHVTCFGQSHCEIQYLHSCNNENDDDDDILDNIRNLSMEHNPKTETESSLDKDDMGNLERKNYVKKRNREAEAAKSIFSSDKSCFVAHVSDSNLRVDTLFLPQKFVRSDGLKKGSNKIVIVDKEVRTWTLDLRFRESSRTFYMRAGWRSFCHQNGLQPGDSVTFKLESCNTETPILHFSTEETKSVSAKRSCNGNEKSEESSQRVSSSSSLSSISENRFVTLTVTPASLKHYRLNLPMRFITVNGMEKAGGKKITLLDKHGVGWPVSLPSQKRNRKMHLGSGFKEFLKANEIKVYESFVLELVWEDNTTPMLKFCSTTKT